MSSQHQVLMSLCLNTLWRLVLLLLSSIPINLFISVFSSLHVLMATCSEDFISTFLNNLMSIFTHDLNSYSSLVIISPCPHVIFTPDLMFSQHQVLMSLCKYTLRFPTTSNPQSQFSFCNYILMTLNSHVFMFSLPHVLMTSCSDDLISTVPNNFMFIWSGLCELIISSPNNLILFCHHDLMSSWTHDPISLFPLKS